MGMTSKEFATYMARMRIYFKLGGPDLENSDEVQAWYDALKDIEPEIFKGACARARDTWSRFPSIADFNKLCGRTFETDETAAKKAAMKVLDAAFNRNLQERSALGELAFAVSQKINGFYDIGQLNLHNAGILNPQIRRLEGIALEIIMAYRDKGIEITRETAPPPVLELRAPLTDEEKEKIMGATSRYADGKAVGSLIKDLKASLGQFKQ